MSSEVKDELDIEYEDRGRRIREAAAAAIKELDQLRSGRPLSRSAFDAETARVAQEKLYPHGCDLVVHWMNGGGARFLIRVRSTGRQYDLIKSFYHRDNGR